MERFVEQVRRLNPLLVLLFGSAVNGIVDLLYRTGETWKIAEFKTDRPRSNEELQTLIQNKGYDRQVQRYARAVGLQLRAEVEAALVFLNVGSDVAIVPIQLKSR